MEGGGKFGEIAALWGRKMFPVPNNELLLPSLGDKDINQEFWGSSAPPNSASGSHRTLGSLQVGKILKATKSRCPTMSQCHLRAAEPNTTCEKLFRALIPGAGQAAYPLLADPFPTDFPCTVLLWESKIN